MEAIFQHPWILGIFELDSFLAVFKHGLASPHNILGVYFEALDEGILVSSSFKVDWI